MKMLVTTQIPIELLEVGEWYIGRGRNGNIGRWDGDDFLVIGEKGVQTGLSGKGKWRNEFCMKSEAYFMWDHPEADVLEQPLYNLGTFQPFLKISDGVVLSNRGENDLDSRSGYGLKLGFESIQKW